MKKLRSLIAILLLLAISVCGAACGGADLETPQGFQIDEENTLSWNEVPEARQYTVEIKSEASGETSSGVTRRNFYPLADLAEGDYEIRVRATGGSRNSLESLWSDPVLFQREHDTGVLFDPINKNTEYAVRRVGTAEGSVTVPDLYRGKPVTSIEDGAFRAANRVTDVTVGPNVRTIGEKAFYNCSTLKSVTLSDSVTEIGSASFQVCNKLESVRLSASLTAIPEYLFAYCRSLKEIAIPDGVQTIGESAFYACSALTEVTLPAALETLGPFAFSQTEVLAEAKFGGRISYIDENAFYGSSVTELVFSPLEEGVQLVIGENAFAGCTALPSVTLPEGTVRLDAQAFYGCSALAEVELPESLTAIGAFVFDDTALYEAQAAEGEYAGFIYADNWLVGATKERKTTLTGLRYHGSTAAVGDDPAYFRDDVVGIASNCFVNCSSLERIFFPSSLRYICSYAFYGSTPNTVVIPANSVKIIGEYAFAQNKTLSRIELGEGLETIGSYAFYGCTQLYNSAFDDFSIIPSTVTRVGTYAFNETGYFDYPEADGVVYAGDWVIGIAEKQASVTLKENVAGIADYAFYEDDALETISGLNRVKVIGRGAFANCYRLARVNLSPNLRTIREYTFRNCSSLYSVSFPTMLETIEQFAFENCGSLSEADLAATRLKTVRMGAFYLCNTERLTLPETLETIGDYAFYGNGFQEVTIPDSVTEIGVRAFALCVKLTQVNFGEGLRSIGDFAFRLTFMTSVALPANLESIGRFAFYECMELKQVTFGEKLETIGDYAFAGVPLEGIVLPDSVRYVGAYAFRECANMTYAVLPLGDCRYGRNAFYGCYRLTVYSADTDAAAVNGNWNSSYCPAVLGCTFSEEGYLVSAQAGSVVNPFAFFGLGEPQREGYHFVGWATAEGGEAEYDIDGLFTAPQGTTLYAVWEEGAPESPDVPETPETPDAPAENGDDISSQDLQ